MQQASVQLEEIRYLMTASVPNSGCEGAQLVLVHGWMLSGALCTTQRR